MDQRYWDDKYGSRDQLFSGEPNGVLVTEASDLTPGQALDVGCGEGADARWLARRGWRVTALDISTTALRRAAETTAADLAERICWTHADLTVTPPPAAAFDLVTAHYLPLPRDGGGTAVRGLLDAVAPGGTLLIAGHDLTDLPPHHESGIDPHAYHQPADLARLLDDHWTILIDETRPRTAPAPPGTRHTHDTVLRARRLP